MTDIPPLPLSDLPPVLNGMATPDGLEIARGIFRRFCLVRGALRANNMWPESFEAEWQSALKSLDDASPKPKAQATVVVRKRKKRP